MEDISQFGWKIKLRAHFRNQLNNGLNDETIHFKLATNKTLTSTPHNNTVLEAFQNDIKLDLEWQNAWTEKLKTWKRSHRYYCDRRRQQCINKILNDPLCYNELIYVPTLAHANTINDTIEMFKIKQKSIYTIVTTTKYTPIRSSW